MENFIEKWYREGQEIKGGIPSGLFAQRTPKKQKFSCFGSEFGEETLTPAGENVEDYLTNIERNK